jgi:hypothetical protein
MSDCPELDIADAVVVLLNEAVAATTLAPAFTAERGYLVEEDLLKTTELKCTVMTVGLSDVNDTRGDDLEVHTVGVALYQKLADVTPATVDPLVSLLRKARKLLGRANPAGSKVIERRSRPLYDPELLQESNVFCGFIELDCRLLWKEGT